MVNFYSQYWLPSKNFWFENYIFHFPNNIILTYYTAKNTVISRDFLAWNFCEKAQANRPKLSGNFAFPQNFHTRKSDEIMVFFAVLIYQSNTESENIQLSTTIFDSGIILNFSRYDLPKKHNFKMMVKLTCVSATAIKQRENIDKKVAELSSKKHIDYFQCRLSFKCKWKVSHYVKAIKVIDNRLKAIKLIIVSLPVMRKKPVLSRLKKKRSWGT